MVGILSRSMMGQVTNVCQEKNTNVRVRSSKARTSERLRQAKKRTELAVKRKVAVVLQPPSSSSSPPPLRTPPPQQPQPQPTTHHQSSSDSVELSLFPIQHGNPSHKILFITRLGLIPTSPKVCPPLVKLQRLPRSEIEKHQQRVSSSVLADPDESDIETIDLDSDEDLDLELVISPVDIPEFFEEIFKKKERPPTRPPQQSWKSASATTPMYKYSNPTSVTSAMQKNNTHNFLPSSTKVVPKPHVPTPAAVIRSKLSNTSTTHSLISAALSKPKPCSGSTSKLLCSSSVLRKMEPQQPYSSVPRPQLKASVHIVKTERCHQRYDPRGRAETCVPFVDLTMDEDADTMDCLREKLLGFDTVLEYVDPRK